MTKLITADEFDDLVDDLSPAGIAAADTAEPGARLQDLVGGWDRIADVSIAPEMHTFTAAGTAAAMTVGLTVRLHDAAPILRSATLIADRHEGRVRLARVEIHPLEAPDAADADGDGATPADGAVPA